MKHPPDTRRKSTGGDMITSGRKKNIPHSLPPLGNHLVSLFSETSFPGTSFGALAYIKFLVTFYRSEDFGQLNSVQIL